MSAPILKRVKALEGRGTGGAHPMLVMVSFIAPREGRPDQGGIDAAPPHFPAPVDRMPGESWDAFTTRLEGRLSHLPGGSLVLAFAQTLQRSAVCEHG